MTRINAKPKGPTARARQTKAARRAREAKSIYAQVDLRDNYTCRACGLYDAYYNQRHHIKYRSRGGAHTVANLVTLCVQDHADVHAKRLRIIGTDANGLLEFQRA